MQHLSLFEYNGISQLIPIQFYPNSIRPSLWVVNSLGNICFVNICICNICPCNICPSLNSMEYISGNQSKGPSKLRIFGPPHPPQKWTYRIQPFEATVWGPTKGLGAADKWMMVTILGWWLQGHRPRIVTIIHLSPGSTQSAIHTIRTRLGGPSPRSFS